MTIQEARAIFFIALSFLLGVLCMGGCAAPVANYSVETRCEDIWREHPKQSIALKIDIKG